MFESGLGDFGATLAARYLGFPGEPWWWICNRGPSLAYIVNCPPDTAGGIPFTVFAGLRITPHFPYGYPVEPDAPV